MPVDDLNSKLRNSADSPIVVERVSKRFRVAKQQLNVLSDIDLTIAPGEFFCIVGGSGCGKSTLLRIIAGLEESTEGMVRIGSHRVTRPGLDRGMVFQEHRLLPWLTIEENIDFGLSGGTRSERKQRVAEHLAMVGLENFASAYPSQVSGGMAQRAGLARALVNRPQVLLLDEPFGALDALTRLQMQQEILRIWEIEQTTMILVTHDIDEAIFLGDRIAVLGGRPGRVKQIFDVPLPRPHDRGEPVFDQLRKDVWDAIFEQDSQSQRRSTADRDVSNSRRQLAGASAGGSV